MIHIGHISDIHGRLNILNGLNKPDVWLVTGDFFPNLDRPIIPADQTRYQIDWFRDHSDQIMSAFGDTDVVWIDGNHDFVCLVDMLKGGGKENCYKVSPDGVMVQGFRFSGFRQIPAICYEWAGETTHFSDLLDKTFNSNPDFLVTHAPAQGMFEGRDIGGIPGLTNRLCWSPHNIKAHCHGHVHCHGGTILNKMDIVISNAAEHVNYFTI